MTRRGLRRDLDEFQSVYNAAWSGNWGFVPYSKEDLDAYALDLQLVYDRDWFMVAENATVAERPDLAQGLYELAQECYPDQPWAFRDADRIVRRVACLGPRPAPARVVLHRNRARETGRLRLSGEGRIDCHPRLSRRATRVARPRHRRRDQACPDRMGARARRARAPNRDGGAIDAAFGALNERLGYRPLYEEIVLRGLTDIS